MSPIELIATNWIDFVVGMYPVILVILIGTIYALYKNSQKDFGEETEEHSFPLRYGQNQYTDTIDWTDRP